VSTIIKHIRDSKHNYIGTFVAVPRDDTEIVNIGWSKCHKMDIEKNRVKGTSSEKLGTQIALSRARNGTNARLPSSLEGSMDKFVERVSKYYKDKKLLPSGVDVA